MPVAVLDQHRRRARQEVAEIVCELLLVAFVYRVERDRAVLAERNRARRPEPDRVDAVDVDQVERVDHVADRLRDLAVVEQQEAVDEDLLRQAVPGREQQRRPEDTVEPQDVLADQVADLGPVAVSQVFAGTGVRQRAQVVDQRVDPDPRDLLGIPRDRHPPRLPLTADAEVLETRLDQAPRLVVTEPRKDEVRTLVVEIEQLLLKVREPKEPVLLFDVLRDRSVVGALPVDELVFRDEGLVPDAVQARVGPLVDVPVRPDSLDELLDDVLVLLVSRPDEEVRLRADAPGQRPPVLLDDLVDEHLRVETSLLRDPIHLRGMLVGPGQEERVLASLAVMAHEDVRRNRRVGVPDVRGRVDVEDGCGQVEAIHRRQ